MRERIKSFFRVESIKWIILAVLLLIPFVSFCYHDTKSIIHYQINFADAIFSGRIGDFYDICYERVSIYKERNISGTHFATYDIVMNALLGIWGIPLYLWCALKGVPEVLWNTSCMLYGKAIYIPALILSVYLIYKICRELEIDKNRSEWASFLFCSSLLVVTDVCIIGQSDILAIPFILAGIFFYLKNDMRKFLFFFMLAITFKMFALFIFIPLLLLKEKRIIRIVGSILVVYSLSFFANLPYALKDTPAIAEKERFAKEKFTMLLAEKIPLMDGNVPVLVVALGLLCAYCYLKHINNEKEIQEYTIFIALASMCVVFLSFPSLPYWYLHLAPYFAIATIYYSGREKSIMLFETVGMVALTFKEYIRSTWCYDFGNTNSMLLEKVCGQVKEHAFTLEQMVLNLQDYQCIFNAVFVVAVITVMWLSKPKKVALLSCDNEELAKCAYIRLAVNVVVGYIPIVLYVLNTNLF